MRDEAGRLGWKGDLFGDRYEHISISEKNKNLGKDAQIRAISSGSDCDVKPDLVEQVEELFRPSSSSGTHIRYSSKDEPKRLGSGMQAGGYGLNDRTSKVNDCPRIVPPDGGNTPFSGSTKPDAPDGWGPEYGPMGRLGLGEAGMQSELKGISSHNRWGQVMDSPLIRCLDGNLELERADWGIC